MSTSSDNSFPSASATLHVLSISDFCPWEPGDIADLDRESSHYAPCNWQRIAEASVAAIRAAAQATDSAATWNRFGELAGLEGDDLQAYDSLYACPIEVYPDAWINGRHRGLLVQRSGATQVAGHDPRLEP